MEDKKIDSFYCSPYKRSLDTIADAAAFFGKEIITDERLREREKGPEGNNHGMFQKRWADRCEDFLRIIDMNIFQFSHLDATTVSIRL